MREIISVVFDNFETLDLFGPVEIFGRMKNDFRLSFCSFEGGIITSSQGVRVLTDRFGMEHDRDSVLLLPGGAGVAALLGERQFISDLSALSAGSEYILTVCTGSILLSKTGLLDNRNATSNKRLFSWALKESPAVNWVRKARWVRDGNIYTSSGISAGMDMTLAFISDMLGHDAASQQAREIEYAWNEDPSVDPFADLY